MDQQYLSFEGGYAMWDDETGTLRIGNDPGENGGEEVVLWPSSAEQLGEWITDSTKPEAPFYIYYRWSNKDHVVQDGDTICHNSVNIPIPQSECLKPFPEVTDHEWSLILAGASNFCTWCYNMAQRQEIFPDRNFGEPPKFPCPECGDEASRITVMMGIASVDHEDGRYHEIDFSEYQDWRRGETVQNE